MRKANSSNSILVRSIVCHGKVASLVGVLMASASTEVLANCYQAAYNTACDSSAPNPYTLGTYNIYGNGLYVYSGTVYLDAPAQYPAQNLSVQGGTVEVQQGSNNNLAFEFVYVNNGGIFNLNNTPQSTGTINLSSGTLENGNISGTDIVSNGGSINSITNIGSLVVSSSGISQSSPLILTGSNSWVGATQINNGGVLQIGSANAFGSNSATTVNSGGIFNLGGYGYTINNLTLAGGTVSNGNLTSAVSSSGGTLNANLVGASSLTNTAGTTILNGANNYTGATIVNNSATLTAGSANAFSSNSATTVNSGGIFNLGGYGYTINNLTLAGGTVSNGNLTSAVSSSGGTLNANLVGASSLTNTAGTTILNGANTYTGATIVSNNTTLTGGSANAFSANSATTVNSGGILNLGGFGQTINNLTITGATVSNGNLTSAVSSSGGTLNANLVGASSLTNTAGTTTLYGANTYTGATIVSNNTTLTAGSANAFSANSATTVNSGGTLNLGGFGQTINNLTIAGATVFNGNLTAAVSSSGGALNANLVGASSLTNNSGTTTLYGANTYTGATIVNSGATLLAALGSPNAISANSATTVNSGGNLNFNGYFGYTINNLTIAGGTVSNGGVDAFVTSSGGTLSASLIGGSITNTSGTTTLLGPNSYSGSTTVNGGTLIIGTAGAYSSNSAMIINSGGTLNLGSFSLPANNFTLNGGTVTNGTLTGAITSNGGTIGANLVASSSLLATTGSGGTVSTTTLLGSNTYTGATTVNSGATLTAGAANTFSATSATTINNNAYLNLGGYNQTINNVSLTGGAMLENGNLSGAISVSGSSNRIAQIGGSAGLTVNSGASVSLSQPNTYTGTTVINGFLEGYGPDVLSATSLTFINSTGSLYLGGWQQTINNVNLLGGTIYGGSFVGAINSEGGTINGVGGSGTLTAASGTTTLQGTNTFSSITVNGGTINNTGNLNGPVTTNSGSSSSLSSNTLSSNRLMSASAQTVSNNPVNSARAQSSMLAPGAGVFNNAGWVTGSLLNNGQLNIIGNQSRISGPITGSGEINVNGAFRQESSITNRVVNVNNGGALLTTAGLNAQSLNIKGGGAVVAASDITAPINVANGGTLTSAGLRNINGDVRNAGNVFLLTPGDKLNVNGAYSQSASGSFTTLIGSTEKYGKVESAQNLNIENGSTINAVIDRRLRPTSGTVYSAVLKGSDAPVQSQINVLTNTPRYNMSAVWNGNQVDLHVSGPYLGALADQTLSSISTLQGPTLNALHQRYAVLNAVMEYDCNKFDKLNFCISAQARTTGFGTQTTGAGVFNIAYRPTNETRIGAYLDYQVAAGNPSTYGPSTAGTLNTGSVNYGYDNATFGGYLGYSQSGYSGRMVNTGVQAIVSGGYNPGKMVTTRALTLDPYGFDFIDSQPGSGTASLNAYYARGLLGYGYALTDKATLMPYLGVRYTDVSRGGYMEGFNAAVTQPLVFNAYYERLVTGFGGMMLNGQMTDQFGVTAGLGTELDFSRAASNFGGYSPIAIQGLTAFGFQHGGSWNGFRPTGTVGAYYDVMPNHRVSLNGYAGQQAWSSRTYTTGLLGYQIAF